MASIVAEKLLEAIRSGEVADREEAMRIAYATDRTTADMLLTSTLLGDETYHRIIPECIQEYANRKL